MFINGGNVFFGGGKDIPGDRNGSNPDITELFG